MKNMLKSISRPLVLSIPFAVVGIAISAFLFFSFPNFWETKIAKAADTTIYVNTASTAGGDCTTNEITGDYRACPTLAAAEALLPADITAGGSAGIWTIVVEGQTADTQPVVFSGTITNSTYYIVVTADSNATYGRHRGVWNSNKYRLEITDATAITVQNNYVKLDGIQIVTLSPTANSRNGIVQSGTLTNGGNLLEVSNCIIKGSGSGVYTQTGIYAGANYSTIDVWNTIIYNIATTGFSSGISAGSYTGVSVSIYNSTVIGGVYSIRSSGSTPTLVVKNSYSSGTLASYVNVDTLVTSASSDTSGSLGLRNIAVNAINFINVSTSTEDFHLPSGSALVGVGTDTSGDSAPFNFITDIDGEDRRGLWDVGADEYIEPSSDVIAPVPGNSGVVATSSITTSGLTLNWTKATDSTSTQANLEYRVYRSNSNNIDTVENIETNGTGINSYTADIDTLNVTGLNPSTLYYFNVVVRDEASNKAVYTTISETTLIDSTLPTITAFVIPETADSLVVSLSTFVAEDDSGTVSGYLLNEISETPAVDDLNWSGTVLTEYSFPSDGERTLYAWVKDAAGNISTSSSDTVTITVLPHWVSPTGTAAWVDCKSNTPLSGIVACSRGIANVSAVAGDIIYFRGGTYTIDNTTAIVPSNGGTSANAKIIFIAYSDETPTFEQGTGVSTGISINGKSWIKVTGMTFHDMLGYSQVRGDAHYNEIDHNIFYNTVNAQFSNRIFVLGNNVAAPWSTHNWFHHNYLSRRANSNPCNEGIDLLRVGMAVNNEGDNYNTVEYNYLEYSGHANLVTYGKHLVIRGNIGHNEPWITGCQVYNGGVVDLYGSIRGSISTTSNTVGIGSKTFTIATGLSASVYWDTNYPVSIVSNADMANAMSGLITSYNNTTGELVVNVDEIVGSGIYVDWAVSTKNIPYYTNPAYNGLYAHRIFAIGDNDLAIDHSNVVEDNRLGFSGVNPNNNGPSALDIQSRKNIVRYNYTYGSMGNGISFKAAVGTPTYSGGVLNHVYNNTTYSNGLGYDYSIYSGLNAPSTGQGIGQSVSGGEGGPATNNIIKNNIAYNNGLGDICFTGGQVATCTPWAGDIVTNNWTTYGAGQGNPLFTNPALTDPTSQNLIPTAHGYVATPIPNLTLQSASPAVNGGIFLTQASGSGISSTTLVVSDAGYFQDGTNGSDLARGVNFFPDWIAIGTVDNVVEISSIDYDTNTITLATSTSWSDNANIWLYKKSDGARVLYGDAPDYGAHEYVVASATSTPIISSIASSTTATTATITWITDQLASSTVYYGTTTAYGMSSTSDTLVTSHSIDVSSLSEYTLYHFYVESTNASSTVATSSDYTFTTSDVTNPSVTGFDVEATSSSLTVNINTFTGSDSGSGVASYLVTETSTTPSVGNAGWAGVAQTVYVFISDGIKTLYGWVKDVAGNISASLNDTVTVDSTSPVISVVASSTAENTATITWTTDESSNSLVQYGPTTSYGSASSSVAVTTSHIINLASLSSGSSYNFRVISTDSYGNTSTSSDYTLTTVDSIAPVISSIATSTTNTTAVITWTTDELATSTVYYGTSSSYGLASSSDTAVTSHSMTLSSLSASTTYNFMIEATDQSGNTSTSSNRSLITSSTCSTVQYATTYNAYPTCGPATCQSGYHVSGSLCVADTCATLTGVASYNAYPTCGVATCASGYTISGSGSSATCVAQSSGGGGGGGSSITVYPVTNPSVITDDNKITLLWTNPTTSRYFSGVKIYRKIGTAPTSYNDSLAELVFTGAKASSTFIDVNVSTSTSYYYSIYGYYGSRYSQVVNIHSSLQTDSNNTSTDNTKTEENISTGSNKYKTLFGLSGAIVDAISLEESVNLIKNPIFINLSEITIKIYKKITALSERVLIQIDKYHIANFIHNGTPTTNYLGAGERGGSVASFRSAFKRLPNSETDWQDVIKIGNGRWPSQRSEEAENRAKITFEKIYLRVADMNNPNDNAAVTIMSYGLRPANRNLDNEKTAILTFKYIFKTNPASAEEWDMVRAIAYSGATR